MTNDLRKYIQIVESQKQLDEAGGLGDKILSKLGGIPGLKQIGAGAEGRVEAKEIADTLKLAWIKHAAKTKQDKKDPEGIKAYFREVGLDDNDISSIKGLNGSIANLKTAFDTGATVIATIIGPELSSNAGGGSDPEEIKGRPTDKTYEANVKYFQHKLKGNVANLRKEALKIQRRPRSFRNNPLALLGWAHLEVNGLEK